MIHQYRQMEQNIVMDVCSGAVHVVDDVVYDAVAIYSGLYEAGITDRAELRQRTVAALITAYGEDDLNEAVDDIEELIDEGELFAPDEYQECLEAFKDRGAVVKALCLHIAHDCNLACRYCFAEEGEYHGRRELMSFETGKKALDFLVAASGTRRNLEVDFFGGEPLMNWETVKRLVAYGRSLEEPNGKHFRFTVTTNGMLLNDEVMEFCNREMDNVVLSLDGRKEVNDRMRPTPGGHGSYDIIVPKFQKFAKQREGQYYVRGTFTRQNLDFSEDALHFLELGFDRFSLEPVVASEDLSEDMAYAIREEDLPKIFAEYDRLAEILVERTKAGRPFTFFHFMIDLQQGPCVAKRLAGCGSGCEYVSVTPNGNIYPCHQFAGEDEFLLGTVDTGITNTAVTEDFRSCNVYSKEKCRNCFARFYCSGGCAANSYHFHGTIHDAYDIGCEMQRKRIECAIAVQAALAADDDDDAGFGDGVPAIDYDAQTAFSNPLSFTETD
ncbi:MAG: thioether cross-link-forming SCIFF peptide maturase [Lachnospiraceae bacterium]|nr:thioether cross-link-forming SCIFF peptide maturase [Lachnospiraceae bacterium]